MTDVKDVEATRRVVAAYAQASLVDAGRPDFTMAHAFPSPCERRGETSESVYTVQGTYQLLVPAEEQVALLERVHAAWSRRGYTITSQRTFPGGGGEVKATDDGYVLALASGAPPALLLLIFSPCYVRP